MPLIVLDGPEKAGKSTIAREIIRQHGGRVRAWGPVNPDDRVYAAPLAEDCAAVARGETVVWDRSWASEHVYASLLGRDRRLKDDPWLGEWLYGRAVQTVGVRVILLGPSLVALQSNRDNTDLPVDPRQERALFHDYGHRYGWKVWSNLHTHDDNVRDAARIWDLAQYSVDKLPACPPAWAGPFNASTVYVGDQRNERTTFPGAWLPFSTPLTMQFARMVREPFMAAWTNAMDCPPQALRHAARVVSLGDRAAAWVKYHVAGVQHIELPHPAFAFRYNTEAGRAAKARIESALREMGGALPR